MSSSLVLQVIANTAIIYIFLVLALRAFGQRQLSQLSTLDLLVIMLLGSAVETAMVTASTILKVGVISALTLLIMNRLIGEAARRNARLRRFLGGQPILLVHEGTIIQKNLHRLGLSEAELMESLREREQSDLANIRFAIFEPNGEITVIPTDANVHCADLEIAVSHAH